MKPIDVRTMSMMLAGTFLVSALALGENKRAANAPAPPSTPAPPAAIQKLLPFAGVWEGDATLTSDGQTQAVRIRHEWKPIADNWGILIHETAEMGEMGTYRSENFLGFDPGAKKVHLFTVSNMADCHDHAGQWNDDRNLFLRYDGVSEGKPLVEEIPVVFEGPDQYSFKSTTTVDGKQTAVLVATMRRQPAMTSR